LKKTKEKTWSAKEEGHGEGHGRRGLAKRGCAQCTDEGKKAETPEIRCRE
jgi:hypothetical protein